MVEPIRPYRVTVRLDSSGHTEAQATVETDGPAVGCGTPATVDPDVEAKAEAFHDYAKGCAAAEQGIYEWHETKAVRYLTVMAFGIGTVNVAVLPRAIDAWRSGAPLGWYLLTASIAASACAAVGVLLALKVLRTDVTLIHNSEGDKLWTAFGKMSVADWYLDQASNDIDIATHYHTINGERGKALRLSYLAMVVAFTLYTFLLALFLAHTMWPMR